MLWHCPKALYLKVGDSQLQTPSLEPFMMNVSHTPPKATFLMISSKPSPKFSMIYSTYSSIKASSKKKNPPHLGKIAKPLCYFKKKTPTHITNYKPITLACTIYKLIMSTLTYLLTSIPLHHSQEGFHPMHKKFRQLQTIIATLEYTKFSNQGSKRYLSI